MPSPRVLLAVATVLAALALPACGTAQSLNDIHTEPATFTAVHVSGSGGSVTVRQTAAAQGTASRSPAAQRSSPAAQRTPAGKAVIHRTISYTGAPPSDDTYWIEGGVLYLETRCGTSCTVSYDVQVPAAVEVTGSIEYGDLRLTGVRSVDVQVASGTASVTRAAGPVYVVTTAGDIRASDIRGKFSARAAAGSITATGIHGTSEVQVRTGDLTLRLAEPAIVKATASDGGNIALRVPAGGRYRLDTVSESGEKKLSIPNVRKGYRLELRTDTGDISVSAA